MKSLNPRSTRVPNCVVALAVLLAACAVTPASAQCFVTRNGGDFNYRGGIYKFVGANLRGIIFHPAAEMDTQITSARNDMGARVVRVFAAKSNLNSTQVGDALNTFLGRVSERAPDMKVLVSLTDFYGADYYPDGSRLFVKGDDAWYPTSGDRYLRPEWFTSGYQTNYKAHVQALVTRFANDDRIFGWELGNELSAANATDMLNFAYEMGWNIRNWGARQMVSTGFIGVNHAIHGGVTDALIAQFYVGPWGKWTSSPFHFGSIHAYNNAQVPGNNPYHLQDKDINWFISNKYPYIVGEGGFNAVAEGGTCDLRDFPYEVFPGGTWDGVNIPAATRGGGRGGAVSTTLTRFMDVKGADGYLPWGFVAGGGDNGEADWCSGMDSVRHTDWFTLLSVYSRKAATLPAGGTGSCTSGCTATVPASDWKGEYFPNTALTGTPSLVRNDGNGSLNFNWGTGGPNTCGIGTDNFSVRWTRTVSFGQGTWRFTARADDGVRLYVDGALKIDGWVDQSATTYTADVPLTAGSHTLVMHYYERGVDAVAQLSWAQIAVNNTNNASLSNNAPGFLMPGQIQNITVGAQNTGGSTWTGGGGGSMYRLGASTGNGFTFCNFPQCGGYTNNILDARVYTCSNVLPGTSYGYQVDARAPTAGATSATFSARMVQDGVEWFGQTTSRAISIGTAYCGSALTQCILNARTDILPFYQGNGWNTSCGNRDSIVSNWCGLDPNGCNSLKTGSCAAFNNACRCSGGIHLDGKNIDPNGTFCGYRVCGLDMRIYNCTSSGWSNTGASCK